MEVLGVLTWIYAGIVVLVLAASLLGIWRYLRRIATVLDEARAALAPTVQNTQPLAGHLESLPGNLADAAKDWKETERKVTQADEHLSMLAERRGLTELAR